MPKSDISRASSGTSAQQSSDDTAVTLISNANMPVGARNVRLVNEGGVAGFYSLDGGTTKERLPSDQTVTVIYDCPVLNSVKLYRIASGADITGLYASAW